MEPPSELGVFGLLGVGNRMFSNCEGPKKWRLPGWGAATIWIGCLGYELARRKML